MKNLAIVATLKARAVLTLAAAGVFLIFVLLMGAGTMAAVSAATAANQSTSGPGGSNYPIGVEPGPWGGWQNGWIPPETLSSIPWSPSFRLRADAVVALTALNEAFKARFGHDIGIQDGYRDYPEQVVTRADACAHEGCSYAAEPGTSNHGWALAADLGLGDFGDERYAWMQQNGPTYGWRHPAWAEPGGSDHPEPWHWEFWGWAGAAGGSGTGDAKQFAQQQLGDPVQFSCLERLWNGESNWNPHAENADSGAYGIPQALPADKLATAGADWRDNAITQVKWGLSYIADRYGTPCDAWTFWSGNNPHWY